MPLTAGLQLPYGVQPVNPLPVDTWSGPYIGPDEATAKAAANSTILPAIRFQSMEVRLIIAGVSRKFWYRDGILDANLVEFTSGGGGTGATGVQGIQGDFQAGLIRTQAFFHGMTQAD
jgi:hypothetical protein